MLTIIKAILNRGNVEYTYDVLQLSTKFTKYTLTAFCKVLFDVNLYFFLFEQKNKVK